MAVTPSSSSVPPLANPVSIKTSRVHDWFHRARTALRAIPHLRRTVVLAVVLAGLMAWSYVDALGSLAHRWWHEPDYLYGFLVPVFSGYLLWIRRNKLVFEPVQGIWWGLPLLGIAAIMRWASAYYYYELLDPMSLLPCLAGLTVFLGGWKALQWSWPAIAFLVFMVPLPGVAAGVLGQQLQRVGTLASTYVLQTVGIPSTSRGNVIFLANAQIGVVEACSGLRMLMLFVAVSTGTALLMSGGILRKVLVALSAAPIAIMANVVRITVTGLLYQWGSHELAEKLFHDVAGFFMMPLAVLLLWAEIRLFSWLTFEEEEGPLVVAFPSVPGMKPRRRKRNRPRGHAATHE